RGAVAPLRQRDGRAAPRAGRHHHRLLRRRGTPATVPGLDHRRAPALAGHRDPAGGRRVHGQRLRADAPPGLRHAARHARRRRPHASRARLVKVTVLGPQRRPTLEGVAASLYPAGAVATVTAGWQEREGDDAELSRLLGSRDVNLRLYQRWLDLQGGDPVFGAGERRLAELLGELQALYLLRLDHALQAVYAVGRRGGDRLGSGVLAEAIETVRELDTAHLLRAGAVRGEFYQRLAPHNRPVIAEHRAEVAGLLGDAAALVVAGGHVGVLADTLHL